MNIPDTIQEAREDGREVRKVPEYPGYHLDHCGVLYGLNGKRRSLTPDKRGYVRAVIKGKRGKLQTKYVHRLMWDTFGPRPIPSNCEIHHLDHNPSNNEIGNLAIGSHEANIRMSRQYGRHFDIAAIGRRNAKPVERVDPDNNQVERFPSLRAAAESLAKPGIGSVEGRTANLCKALKRGLKAYGYHWKYV